MRPEILPVPAFRDNYIWLLHNGQHAAVVDPGDAAPVLQELQARQLQLEAIFITHHHADHTGGISQLLQHYPSAIVYAPRAEHIAGTTVALDGGEAIHLPKLDISLQVIPLPGHTLGHIGYYGANALFCGDTLFGAGCGRLFEGSPAQMYDSLMRLAALPDNTQVFCAHEYTASNLEFARTVEPDNPDIAQRIQRVRAARLQNRPSLPSTLAEEKATNPFLRLVTKQVLQSAYNYLGHSPADPVSTFAALREWKNNF